MIAELEVSHRKLNKVIHCWIHLWEWMWLKGCWNRHWIEHIEQQNICKQTTEWLHSFQLSEYKDFNRWDQGSSNLPWNDIPLRILRYLLWFLRCKQNWLPPTCQWTLPNLYVKYILDTSSKWFLALFQFLLFNWFNCCFAYWRLPTTSFCSYVIFELKFLI